MYHILPEMYSEYIPDSIEHLASNMADTYFYIFAHAKACNNTETFNQFITR